MCLVVDAVLYWQPTGLAPEGEGVRSPAKRRRTTGRSAEPTAQAERDTSKHNRRTEKERRV